VNRGHPAARRASRILLGRGVSACLLLIGGLCHVPATIASVEVELVIPPAETHVIGDHTPLYWRFVNLDSEPVAFMWEGCCRLNGRLTVTAPGRPITPIPPGQALAHMFAKAEILHPGQPADFETRISDWVQLHESGTYRLEGHYVGVLPEQTPQVPAHLKLWRDSAQTPPIEYTVLGVTDYLAQRTERATQRQLQLELAGPTRVEPLQPSPLQLTIRNAAGSPQRMVWPNDFQLWIVDPDGQRVGHLPLPVDGTYEELVIPPGAALERAVPFDWTRLEGEPFASYKLFVDLEPVSGAPRLPSNPLDVQWQLEASEVHQLVLEASRGPRMGLRNPALKLLRVYLAELGPDLAAMDLDTAPAQARNLRDQLRLASCLKSFAPEPGRVDLTLTIPAMQRAHLSDPMIETCATHIPPVRRIFPDTTLEAILAVRRHLGWEVALNIQPDPDTLLDTVRYTLRSFDRFAADLATHSRALIHADSTNVPTSVTFRSHSIPATFLLRLTKPGGTVRLEFARKAASLIPLPQGDLFRGDEILQAAFQAVENRAVLDALLDTAMVPPQTLVLVEPNVTWSELLDALDPILSRHISVTLVTLDITSQVDPANADPSW
jgi:hypothetical protein